MQGNVRNEKHVDLGTVEISNGSERRLLAKYLYERIIKQNELYRPEGLRFQKQ